MLFRFTRYEGRRGEGDGGVRPPDPNVLPGLAGTEGLARNAAERDHHSTAVAQESGKDGSRQDPRETKHKRDIHSGTV